MQKKIDQITTCIQQKRTAKEKVVVAIDGRCASGKTTLAEALHTKTGWDVIHVDDFFLQPHQRNEERLKTPGNNFDRERFYEEVITNLNKPELTYRPYSFHQLCFLEPVTVCTTPVIIIEGSYSCHPSLMPYYDLTIFSDIDAKKQIERLKKRDASKLDMFIQRWIPLEEEYFRTFDIAKKCDLVIRSDG